jgi:glyoxylase-like metal-dependent hydrolase (beta-lactamase superfamily II)
MTTTLSRRRFLTRAAAGAAGLAAGASLVRMARAQVGDEPLKWQDLSPRVRVVLGQGGNSLVALGDGSWATLLVDVKIAPAGKPLRELVEASGRKVSLVVNTHHHGDHTGGNWVFTQDTPVLAQEKCPARMGSQWKRSIESLRAAGVTNHEPGERLFVPTETFAQEKTLDIGGVAVLLRHLGPAHTDNDAVVFLPKENTLHTGDLVFNGLHPFIDRPAGATTVGWMAALEELIKMCDASTVVVPGHGDVGTVEALRRQIAYFEAVRKAVQAAIDSGKTLEEVTQMQVPGFENYGFEQIRPRTLTAVYEELGGK